MKLPFTLPGFPNRRLVIYAALLFVTILLGVVSNLTINGTPPPTAPITAAELDEFEASLQSTTLTQKP